MEATKSLVGRAPDLVAIDMPLALSSIEKRRKSDQLISVTFGKHWCSTHTPSATRPGKISDQLRLQFDRIGYNLCVDHISTLGLIEVYPHPALVQLTGEPKRLPYKLAKAASYWPKLSVKVRRLMLSAEWDSIGPVLEGYLKGSQDQISAPIGERVRDWKAREDILDAIVCCVVGIRALDGAAKPYGDKDSAIWVPDPDKQIMAKTLLPSSPYSTRAEMRMELFADALQRGEYPELAFPELD